MRQLPSRFRFFSSRVFGVWVDATVKKMTSTVIVLSASFYGNRWTEKVALDTEFYYESGHPLQGEVIKG